MKIKSILTYLHVTQHISTQLLKLKDIYTAPKEMTSRNTLLENETISVKNEQSLLTQWAKLKCIYRNVPKFRTNRLGQTVQTQIRLLLEAPREAVWSGSTLFAILSASFGLLTLW